MVPGEEQECQSAPLAGRILTGYIVRNFFFSHRLGAHQSHRQGPSDGEGWGMRFWSLRLPPIAQMPYSVGVETSSTGLTGRYRGLSPSPWPPTCRPESQDRTGLSARSGSGPCWGRQANPSWLDVWVRHPMHARCSVAAPPTWLPASGRVVRVARYLSGQGPGRVGTMPPASGSQEGLPEGEPGKGWIISSRLAISTRPRLF